MDVFTSLVFMQIYFADFNYMESNISSWTFMFFFLTLHIVISLCICVYV